jgi:hypothetical protein
MLLVGILYPLLHSVASSPIQPLYSLFDLGDRQRVLPTAGYWTAVEVPKPLQRSLQYILDEGTILTLRADDTILPVDLHLEPFGPSGTSSRVTFRIFTEVGTDECFTLPYTHVFTSFR